MFMNRTAEITKIIQGINGLCVNAQEKTSVSIRINEKGQTLQKIDVSIEEGAVVIDHLYEERTHRTIKEGILS